MFQINWAIRLNYSNLDMLWRVAFSNNIRNKKHWSPYLVSGWENCHVPISRESVLQRNLHWFTPGVNLLVIFAKPGDSSFKTRKYMLGLSVGDFVPKALMNYVPWFSHKSKFTTWNELRHTARLLATPRGK